MKYSSSLSSNAKVDVFLNFRGEVRRGFLSHLSHALARLNIRYFMNDEEEEKKESTKMRKLVLPPKVLRAISESKVAVVVLSKNYASSSWCLDELVELTEKKLMVMVPVYYEVAKLDVQNQTGSFGEDFRRHGQVEIPETVERWKQALTKLTVTVPDFSPQSTKDEAKLIRKITRHVSGLLPTSRFHKDLHPGKACGDEFTSRKTSRSQLDSDSDQLSPIAMDRQMESIHEVLKLESTSVVRVVGISGVTGIGKTTIARHLYQKLSSDNQVNCFFETASNILDHNSGAQGIAKYINQNLSPAFQNYYCLENSRNFQDQATSLGSQEELLYPKSLKRKATTHALCSDLGSDDTKRTRIGQQRVYVIVDNVEIKQLKEIMKDVKWLGPGSRVIVTTQDKSSLLECGVEHVYEVDCLKYDEALELFSECAFKKQYPPANFEQLSVRAVKLTGCLPLGLKLLGSFLRGRTTEDWEHELKKREARQDEAIVELLKPSQQGSPKRIGKVKCRRSEKNKTKSLLNY